MQRHIITTTSSSALAVPTALTTELGLHRDSFSSHPAAFPSCSRYSRPSTELNRSDGACGARGVSQQLLHRDAN